MHTSSPLDVYICLSKYIYIYIQDIRHKADASLLCHLFDRTPTPAQAWKKRKQSGLRVWQKASEEITETLFRMAEPAGGLSANV